MINQVQEQFLITSKELQSPGTCGCEACENPWEGCDKKNNKVDVN